MVQNYQNRGVIMKSTSKKLILISFVLAVMATLSVFIYLQSLNKPKEAVKNTTILVAVETIPPRTLIDKKMVKEIQLSDNSIFQDYIANLTDVIGKYSKETILKNEGFHKDKLLGSDSNELSVKIQNNFRGISINVSGDSGVSNLILPGDFVDIVAFFAEKKDGIKIVRPDISKIILQNIEVVAVDKKLNRDDNGAVKVEEKTIANFLVTLAVKNTDIEKVVLAEGIGSLKLALRPIKDEGINGTKGTTYDMLMLNEDTKTQVTDSSNNASKDVNYTVKQGDTLKKISTEFYGDPEKFVLIKEANNIDNENLIVIGEVIKIPKID